MANGQTIEITLKTVSDISDVLSNVKQLQNVINQLKIPDTLRQNFNKLFENVEKDATKASQALTNGFKTKGEVNNFSKDLDKISVSLEKIQTDLNKVDGKMLEDTFKNNIDPQKLQQLNEEITKLESKLEQIRSDNLERVKTAIQDVSSISKAQSWDKFQQAFQSGNVEEMAKALGALERGYTLVATKNGEASEKAKQYRSNLDILQSAFTELTGSSSEYGQTVERLSNINLEKSALHEEAIKKGAESFDQVKTSAEQAGKSFTNDYAPGAKQAAENTQQISSELDQFKSRIAYFFGAYNAVNLFKRALRSALETVKDLDKVMTETAVVTSFDVGDMWAQLPEYTKRANELGVSIHDAYEAATLYYQQGLKTNEVMAVSNETLKMARIAGLDAADATDRMTNALRGFNMEINESNAQNINDVYSNLAAKTASNVDEISTAMTKVASLANNANMSFENTAAFLSQIIETTRESAETAGTALKTVIARFSEVKSLYSEGELLGDFEGEEIDVNKVSKALRTAGINLNEYLTGAKGLDEIFMELSAKWDSLDQVQQRYIATMAAGSRQQSRFIALMQDNARMTELVQEANNATGASQKQFEKTLESLETKLNQLKNAWNTFLMGLADNEAIKFVIDLLRGLLEGINNLLSGMSGVPKSIASIALAIGTLKIGKAVFNKMLSGVGATFLGKGQEAGRMFNVGLKTSIKKNGTIFTKGFWKDLWYIPPKAIDTSGIQKLTDASKASAEATKKANELRILESRVMNDASISTAEYADIDIKAAQAEYDAAIATQAKDAALTKLGITEEGYNKLAGLGLTQQEMAIGADLMRKGSLEGLSDAEIKAKISEEMYNKTQQKGIVGALANTAATWANRLAKLHLIPANLRAKISEKLLGDEAVKTSTKLLISLGVIGAIIAAVALLVVGIVALIKAIKNSTPEAKLKAAEEAAENAAKAAEHAKEAYTDLASAFDSLKDKYKNLDDLTKGTDEWRKAMHEVNGEVLDLITKYPELAGLVKNEGGVLKLDIDSAAAQEVLNRYQANSFKANSAAITAKMQVSYASLNVASSQYLKNNFGNIDEVRTLAKEINDGILDTDLEIESRARQLGQLSNLSETEVKALQEYSKSYKKYSVEQDAYYTALAANAAQLTGLEGEMAEYAQNYLSANRYRTFEAEAAKEIDVNKHNHDNYREQYAVLMGYNSYSEFKKANNDKDASDEEIEAALRSAEASEKAADAAEDFAKNLKNASPIIQKLYSGKGRVNLKDVEAVFGSQTLEDLSGKKLSDLKLDESFREVLDKQYKELYPEVKEITDDIRKSADYKELEAKAAEAYYNAIQGYADATETIRVIGANFTYEHQERFSAVDYEATDTFNKRLRNITMAYGEDIGADISKNMGEILARIKASGKDPTEFVEALNSINWNVRGIQDLEETLQGLGINIDYNSLAFKNLKQDLLNVAEANNKIDMKKTVEALENLNSVRSKFVKGEATRVWSKEDIEKMKEAGVDPEILAKFEKNLDGDYVFLGKKLDDLREAIEEAYGLQKEKNKIESAINAQEVLSGEKKTKFEISSGQVQKAEKDENRQKILNYGDEEKAKKELMMEAATNFSKTIDIETQRYIGNTYNTLLSNYLKENNTTFDKISADVFHSLLEQAGFEINFDAINDEVTRAFNPINLTASNFEVESIEDLDKIKEEYVKEILLQQYLDSLEESGFDLSIIGTTSDSDIIWGPEVTAKDLRDSGQLDQAIADMIAFYQHNFQDDLDTANISNLASVALTAGVDSTVVGEYKDALADADETQKEFLESQLKIITSVNAEATALGIDTEQLKNYVEALKAANPDESEANLYQQALAAFRLNQGLEKIIDTYKDWTKLIGPDGKFIQPTTPEDVKILNDFKENLKETFGISDKVADAFLDDAGNLALMKKAAEGDKDAIEELQNKINELRSLDTEGFLLDIQAKIDLDEFSNEYQALVDFINKNELPKLEAGVELNREEYSQFIDDLYALMEATGMSADQINAALWSIGYEVEVVNTPVTIPMLRGNGGTFLGGDRLGRGNVPLLFDEPGNTTINVPEIHFKGRKSHQLNTSVLEKAEKNNPSNTSSNSSSSKPTYWTNPYDELYNLQEKINKAIREREALERRYQKLLKSSTASLEDIRKGYRDQIAALQEELRLQQQLAQSRLGQISRLGNQLYTDANGNRRSFNSYNVQRYVQFNAETGEITIDWAALEAIANDPNRSDEGKAIETYINKLQELVQSYQGVRDAVWKIEDEMEQLQQEAIDSYVGFEDRVMEALVSQYQKEIDSLEKINDTINDATSKMLDSIQEQIEAQRQERQNAKTEEEIAKKEARLAYLRQDTSGANSLEIMQLEKELEEARQNYEDTLIDQALEQMRKDADLAAEQRAQQIEIMRAQLQRAQDTGALWDEVYSLINGAFDENGEINMDSDLVKLLQAVEGFDAFSAFGQDEWIKKFVEALWQAWAGLEAGGADQSGQHEGEGHGEGYGEGYGGGSNEGHGGGPGEGNGGNAGETPEQYPYGKASETTGIIQKGSHGRAVQAIQWALNQLGFGNSGTNSVDGNFGAKTEEAVKHYQRQKGLTADGKVGNKTRQKFALDHFKRGGLADFTGPAWLDGTKLHPEMVLNPRDTENLIALKDILSQIIAPGIGTPGRPTGDAYYDIDINADIGSDYDVQRLADEIKREITQSMNYRNVNTINFIR